VTGQTFLTLLLTGSGRVVRAGRGASKNLGGLLRSLAAPRPSRYLPSPSGDCSSLLGSNFRTVYRDALKQAAGQRNVQKTNNDAEKFSFVSVVDFHSAANYTPRTKGLNGND
jgi:hypothetical protein